MLEEKSNVLTGNFRKASVSAAKSDSLNETNKNDRINHAADACKKSGHYSRVPNCIYEMGLSSQDREIWMYFNRLPRWEHPRVDEIHKAIGVRKAGVLSGIERLCELNMLVVEGEGKNRKFHIPHPSYWKHELPQSQYAVSDEDEKPADITNGMFKGEVKKRSARNVPSGTKENVPPGTKKRSARNEKEPKNVPPGTKNFPQSQEPQGLEARCKTYSQDLIRLSKSGGSGASELPRGKAGVSLEELEGAMACLYVQFTKPGVFTSVVREMERRTSREHILEIIEAQRKKQRGLVKWDVNHKDIWLARIDEEPAAPEPVYEPAESEPVYEQLEEIPFPNDFPF